MLNINSSVVQYKLKPPQDITIHPFKWIKLNKKVENIKLKIGCGTTGAFIHCWEGKILQPPWQTVGSFLNG